MKHIIEANFNNEGLPLTHYFEVDASSEEAALDIFNNWNKPFKHDQEKNVLNDPGHIYGSSKISSKSRQDIETDIQNGNLMACPAERRNRDIFITQLA